MQNLRDTKNTPLVKEFFDPDTFTYSYVVQDNTSNSCAIIDCVLGFAPSSGRTNTEGADAIIAYIEAQNLSLEWIIETHIHADHVSAAPYIKSKLGGKIAVSEKVKQIQTVFGKIFGAGSDFANDGSQFDFLFRDNEAYKIGNLDAKAILTPGHTPACMTHIIGDAVFVGDTIFMPDIGTARADFPGGDAVALYNSIRKILELPKNSRLFMCHDYPPDTRNPQFVCGIDEQISNNIHIKDGIGEEEFTKMRRARDATLQLPRLIIPSVQVNMRAGNFPEPESDGNVYLKTPINLL